MDWYWKLIVGVSLAGSIFYSVEAYTNGLKAQKAMELGYQECQGNDRYGNTIILYKKECE